MSDQKIAFITGANRGIGFEVARMLAQRDYRVIIGSRNVHNGERAVEELKQGGLAVELVQIDVADTSSILSAANEIARRVAHLDLLVNNAAYYVRGGTILDTTEKQLTSMLKTNAFSALLLTRSLWGLLKLGPHPGRIINVSSDLAQLGDLDDRAPAFSISKTALNAITVHLAAELKQHGIAVNAVCPGATDGEIWGEETDRNILEAAETVAWLACDAPDELTGKFMRDKQEIHW
jgi:NAD(P)-dependent dehydrogenase (short-subunit alcohol dehydrogenase family)